MPVAITCPNCQTSFRAPDEALGKNVRCAKCQQFFVAALATPDWLGAEEAPAAALAAPVTAPAASQVLISCLHCQASFRAPEQALGKNVRCTKCQQLFLASLATPDWLGTEEAPAAALAAPVTAPASSQVVISCLHCKASFRAPEQALGKNVRCTKCQRPFLASLATPDRATAEPASPPAATNQVCPACHASFPVPESALGQSVRCVKCQKPFPAAMPAPDWVTSELRRPTGVSTPPISSPARPTAHALKQSATIPSRPAPAARASVPTRQRSSLTSAAVFGVSLGVVLGLFGLAGLWLYNNKDKESTSPSSQSSSVAQATVPVVSTPLVSTTEAKQVTEPKEVVEPAEPQPAAKKEPEANVTTPPESKENPPVTAKTEPEPKAKTDPAPRPPPVNVVPVPAGMPMPMTAVPVPDTTMLPPVPGQPLEPKVAEQVKLSLQWLAAQQRRDGAWPTGMGDNRDAILATTGFACVALIASGDPTYDPAIHRAARYMVDNIFADKSPTRINLGRKFDQSNWKIALGGICICEYYAWRKARDPKFDTSELDPVLDRIVEEAFKRMEPSGGWGHTPTVLNPLNYLELEVVGHWMLASVGACQRLGRKVPEDKLQIALKYVENCCAPGQGGVGYSSDSRQRGHGCVTRTGGALFAFGLLKQNKLPFYTRMVMSYIQNIADCNEGHGSLALGMLGGAMGAGQLELGKKFDKLFQAQLLGNAEADGKFKHLTGKSFQAQGNADNMAGPTYNTAIYTLILQLGNGRLHFMGKRHK